MQLLHAPLNPGGFWNRLWVQNQRSASPWIVLQTLNLVSDPWRIEEPWRCRQLGSVELKQWLMSKHIQRRKVQARPALDVTTIWNGHVYRWILNLHGHLDWRKIWYPNGWAVPVGFIAWIKSLVAEKRKVPNK